MAQSRKTPDGSYQRLKRQLKEGAVPCRAYLFHGEEHYLLRHYLRELRRLLLPPEAEVFNYHAVEGRDLTVQGLAELVEALPMLSERTMVVVTDWSLYDLPEAQRESLAALLADMPAHCCLIFVYDTAAYKPNRACRRLHTAIETYVTVVEFRPQEPADLIPWIARRFRSLGKDIDRQTAEHLIFLCGTLMTGLVQEISKIAAYAQGQRITPAEIDAVVDPLLTAEIFKLTDAVIQGRQDRAASILGNLLKLREEPVAILAALGGQMRRLYTARLALEEGRDRAWLTEVWQMREYPAKLLTQAARSVPLAWCARGVKLCQEADLRMKSARGQNDQDILKLLLVRLGAERP